MWHGKPLHWILDVGRTRSLLEPSLGAGGRTANALLITLAKIAIRLACNRLVWQHKETTRRVYEQMGAVTIDHCLTLRMDRAGIDSFLSTQPTLAPAASVWKGPLTVDAVHSAIDSSLDLVNTVLKENKLRVTRATASNITDIEKLVQALADYVNESDAVNVSGDQFCLDGFDTPTPLFYCVLVDDATTGVCCGIALIYFGYDMDTGRFIYLEDFFIEEAYRGKKGGTMVMFALASIARTLDCGGFMWQALERDAAARAFYDNIGGHVQEGLLTSRFAADGLFQFAQRSQSP